MTASCTLARIDHALTSKTATDLDRQAAELYLNMANRRFDQALHDLHHNDDTLTTRTANAALRAFRDHENRRARVEDRQNLSADDADGRRSIKYPNGA